MDFSVLHDALVKAGYSDDTADAKIAHDAVLKAIYDAGFHDNVMVKGGVVMSGLTEAVWTALTRRIAVGRSAGRCGSVVQYSEKALR